MFGRRGEGRGELPIRISMSGENAPTYIVVHVAHIDPTSKRECPTKFYSYTYPTHYGVTHTNLSGETVST